MKRNVASFCVHRYVMPTKIIHVSGSQKLKFFLLLAFSHLRINDEIKLWVNKLVSAIGYSIIGVWNFMRKEYLSSIEKSLADILKIKLASPNLYNYVKVYTDVTLKSWGTLTDVKFVECRQIRNWSIMKK